MNKENSKIKVIISIIALITLVIGATYAYFKDQIDKGKQTDIIVKSKTTDLLTFEMGDPIGIEVNQQSFASGKGNLYSESFAQANLIANNNTNEATANYNVYVLVNSNNYLYTQSDKRAEMLLSITDPEGNELTSLDGLKHVSVTDATGTTLTGFDITTYKGLINVASNYEINSTSSTDITSQKWIIRVTFVNYDVNQSENGNKEMFGKIIIQQETMENPTVADLCNEGEPLNDCIIGLSKYDYNIYNHDGSIKDADGNVIDANDGSYRYAGANPDNYVCFGTDINVCPESNLYRIIGLFYDTLHEDTSKMYIKLMKATPATKAVLGSDGAGYSSSSTSNAYTRGSSIWADSVLNTINLNTNYLNSLDEKWSNKILDFVWVVGGNTIVKVQSVTPAVAYYNEILFPKESSSYEPTYKAKIGLPYVSDYGFAASINGWTSLLSSYNTNASDGQSIKSWMKGISGWSITSATEKSYVYQLGNSISYFEASSGMAGSYKNIYPTFYIKSDTKFISGAGTKTNPFRID